MAGESNLSGLFIAAGPYILQTVIPECLNRGSRAQEKKTGFPLRIAAGMTKYKDKESTLIRFFRAICILHGTALKG
jgi:hypothetical protein